MMVLYEWCEDQNPFSGEALTRFAGYLDDVWASRNQYIERDEEEEETSIRQQFFQFSFDGKITPRNYAGVVQFEGKRLQVRPKILKDKGDDLNWKQNLFFWLSYCRRINFPFSLAELNAVDFEELDFLELLIYIFAHYTEDLVSNQPYQSYQTIEEESPYLKGRLLFDTYATRNLATGRWQHFYVQHQPFVYDNLFNRIVKCVARRLLRITRHQGNQEKLNSLLFLLDEVTDIDCVAGDCDRVRLNVLYSGHQQILGLCRLYLSNQLIDTSGRENDNFCFLLPMEYVFEDFILGFLESHFPGYKIRRQSEAWLARSGGTPVFKIKNDAFIPEKLIIDTKYKLRSPNDGLKGGVSQADMYQMLAYAIRRNCGRVLLLYPYHERANNQKTEFLIGSDMLEQSVEIVAASVDICFRRPAEAVAAIKEQLARLISR